MSERETSGEDEAAGDAKAVEDAKAVDEVKPPPPAAPPPSRFDALGKVAFVAYLLVGGAFVFGFGRTLTSAVETQNETPCRALEPRHARLTGIVLDEAGDPVVDAEVVPVIEGRTKQPTPVRPDGTFSVFMPKHALGDEPASLVRVHAKGKAELEAELYFSPSEVVDVEVTLGEADPKTGEGTSTLVEKSRTVWEAPDFTAKDLEGNEVQLSSFRGKLVVLNFWATWCEPCITEWPQVAKLARRLAEDGEDDVAVLAVSIDQSPAPITPFLELMTLFDSPVRVLWDETTKLHEAFGSEKIPDTFFVDEQGRVSAVFVNVREWGSPDALHCVESTAGG